MVWVLMEVDLISSPLTSFCLCLIWLIRCPTYRQNTLRANIQKTLEEAIGCISDTRATQAKYLGFQNII